MLFQSPNNIIKSSPNSIVADARAPVTLELGPVRRGAPSDWPAALWLLTKASFEIALPSALAKRKPSQ